MIAVNPIINTKLKEKKLPGLSYRISADYGKVEVAKSLTSTSEDLFGPTVNLCSKINSRACPNQMVVGNNLYKITKAAFSINENNSSFLPFHLPPSKVCGYDLFEFEAQS
jgi:class 3 adenylate cyclase